MKAVIQVGVGGMGQVWARFVGESAQWEAAAYVDVNQANLHAAAERHGLPKERCFTDLRRALDSVEACALLDVTPQQFRKSVCLEAFKRGLHVLSEKPLADTLPNAQAIVQAARKARRIYMVAQNYRYQPVFQTARKHIADGLLGEIGYVGVNFHKGPHFGGFREVMAFPLVLDMSIHHFDLMRFLLGSDIKSVTAVSIDAPWNWNKGDATIMAQLAAQSGIAIHYFGSWVSSGWETPWNAEWRIEGAKGVLLIERDELFFSSSPEKREQLPLLDCPLTHQAYLLEAFGKCIDAGEEPETSGRRNLNSLATTHAVVRAAKEKRRVMVREMLRP